MKSWIYGEWDKKVIRFSKPDRPSIEVNLTYEERDRIITCSLEQVQDEINNILANNRK